jgi:hypothetical protein
MPINKYLKHIKKCCAAVVFFRGRYDNNFGPVPLFVTPAQAGVQFLKEHKKPLDSGLRGNDNVWISGFYNPLQGSLWRMPTRRIKKMTG